MEILEEFGVKPVLLAAQVVNFLLLLFILKRFLYKPLLKVLEERKNKIAQSLKSAEEIEKKLEQTTLEQEKVLAKAAAEAKEILAQATKNADSIISQAHDKAGKDIEKLMEKSKQSMEQEKEKIYGEIKEELADLVVLGLEKVASKSLTEKEKKELTEKSLKGMI